MEASVLPAMHPRIRSSIACQRCRRSKIKCVNTGVNTMCKACDTSGRECVYPMPGVGSPTTTTKREGDTPEKGEVKKQRTRKSEGDAGDRGTKYGSFLPKERSMPLTDALDAQLLTQHVWQEVFELFQLHFSTDLPFLHGPTFLNPLRGAAASLSAMINSVPGPQDAETKLPGLEMLLLGVLALTARFHPRLVAHHSSSSPKDSADPITASEYYATALRAMLAREQGAYMGEPNLHQVQALLMLGLHEWGMCKGVKAWIYVGCAVRMAQAMGLQYEDGVDHVSWTVSSATRIEAQHLGLRTGRASPLDPTSSEAFVDEEIRRRTVWSCFIMDRYLSSGKYRPTMLAVDDIWVQLPSSDNAFAFGERVCTSLIDGKCSGSGARAAKRAHMLSITRRRVIPENKENAKLKPEDSGRHYENTADQKEVLKVPCEMGSDESILSRFVRMVEIWGKIAKWSCSGGRRTEQHPPWDPQSTCYQLRKLLRDFCDNIPRPFRLTPSNIQAHLTQRTSSAFTLLHTLYSLCLIILNREYVPFVPIRCEGPEGPLDSPTFPPDLFTIPSGFWADGARELFKAARDIIDLVQACQVRGMLVETPILGFGLYTAAFVGLYASNFPHMDPDGYMCGKGTNPDDTANGQQAARKALEMIGQMRSRLPMASNWFRTCHRVHRYYEKIIVDYTRNTQALRKGSSADRIDCQKMQKQLSLREGGAGGGVEQFRLLEKTLKEFGSIEDEDLDGLASDADRQVRRTSSTSSRSNDSQAKTEDRPSDNWTAINNTANPGCNRSEPIKELPNVPVNRCFNNEDHNQGVIQIQPLSTENPRPRFIALSPNGASHMSPDSNTNSTPTITSNSPYQPPEHNPEPQLPKNHSRQVQLQPQLKPQQPPPSHYYGPEPYVSLSMHPTASSIPVAVPPASESDSIQFRAPWTSENQERWLNSLPSRIGGYDVAAFLDGSDLQACFHAGLHGGYNHGQAGDSWMSEVWGWRGRGDEDGGGGGV